jgi:thymidylate synthase (FAD)
MQIIKPYAKMMAPTSYSATDSEFSPTDGIALLRRIEWCGRISHRSEEAQTGDSYERFIKSVVLDHGDWSIVEHASVSCDFYVDRGITHELVRHRLFAFTQESTRFVNYEKKMLPSFVLPVGIEERTAEYSNWTESVQMAEEAYKALIANGKAPQIARSVFPNALASRIIITGNLRNWRHFFIMRTTKEAHPQMREVTIPLLTEFKHKIPILFDDIEPMAKQSESMKKGR